jgi:hypothetical protein
MVESQRIPREAFRRSWLTLAPEWSLSGGVSLAVALAAHHFRLQGGWEVPGLTMLPIAWAAGRTLLWACRTWTATADGRLIVQEGILRRSRQVIHLCSARQIEPEAPLLIRWLSIGHITFQATNPQGQLQRFRWTWLGRYSRLCEIIQARGQLPVGRPSRRQFVASTVERLVHAVGIWLAQGWALSGEIVTRLRGRWFVDDYGRFLAFCHHLLRSTERSRWPPSRVPSAVAKRWMAVLRQAYVVVDAPNGRGWRVAGAIRSLEDVCRRIGEEELQRAVQRSANLVVRQR